MYDVNILECVRFTDIKLNTMNNERIIKDYELDFHMTGNFETFINDKHICLDEGDILFKKPGERCHSIGHYDCWIISLDFSLSVDGYMYKRQRKGDIQQSGADEFFKDVPTHIKSRHFNECISIIHKIITASAENKPTLVNELIMLVLADAFHTASKVHKEAKILKNALYYIHENFSEKISIPHLAEMTGYSANYFNEIFKKEMGTTPGAYIIKVRLENAEFMLNSTEFSISEIAERCGYMDTSLFIRQFKNKNKMTPLQYRMR